MNTSDASVFADQFGCCPSRVWGFLWLVISFIFFALGIIVGLAAFKVSFDRFSFASSSLLILIPSFKQNLEQQKEDAAKFLPVPGSKSAATMLLPDPTVAWVVAGLVWVAGSVF